ncbi:beta-ketoacyl synthase N-terminal-like domain-containing protein [Corynebacterium glyciniphilum]|uniref:beta-ketoacyl synthase N-terminal-like domain-containing protein n=1 Tax=Corynebacterium glyciniphilum TaxID=1404244 RepID=UPI0034E95BC0
MLPGKLAYEHDLRGPSLYLSTTCSSFGYMLNIAAHFLRTSDLDNVLLLSSNMELPESSPALSQIISKDNSCRPFTLHRDGSIAGRGYGGVLLSTSTSTQFSSNKSCEIELLDCSVSTAGRERASFGAPSRSAQLSNIRSSYRRAGISPAACVYTEAHGTGTVIGDAIEARVLREVFETVREPVWIGSAKEHVGHLDATAGLASICRVVNSFSGGLIPTSLPRNVASQDFDLLGPSLRLVPQSVEWPDSAVTGVHMVGFSGASAHAIFRMRKETV